LSVSVHEHEQRRRHQHEKGARERDGAQGARLHVEGDRADEGEDEPGRGGHADDVDAEQADHEPDGP
jgi:hypothetical protein